MYAITPKGVGKHPGIRAIKDTWELKESETFSVAAAPLPSHVLDESGVSFREKTPEENAAEEADTIAEKEENEKQDEILRDTKGGQVFAASKRFRPAQIDAMIKDQFGTFTPRQQDVMKFLVRVATLSLRRMK